MPFLLASAGVTASSENTRRAARTVESCSSSLEPKWANRPLLLMPSSPARRAIERSCRPSEEASRIEAARIARRVLSPRARRPSVGAGPSSVTKLMIRK